jgi:hypothetical protein
MFGVKRPPPRFHRTPRHSTGYLHVIYRATVLGAQTHSPAPAQLCLGQGGGGRHYPVLAVLAPAASVANWHKGPKRARRQSARGVGTSRTPGTQLRREDPTLGTFRHTCAPLGDVL